MMVRLANCILYPLTEFDPAYGDLNLIVRRPDFSLWQNFDADSFAV
jgi:hypothetical protein